MKLRQKILVLAIAPLILAVFAIALAVHYQAVVLANQQRASVEAAYLASKEAELAHYVSLATRSIAHLYESGHHDDATLNEAKAILAKLDNGDDGYFFMYDLQGKNLMHPRQPDLVGRNLWNLKDANGNPTIQRLINQAKAGGGFVRYLWEKPSSGKVVPKLGYVVLLDRWGWMLGTGIYLDDVDTALAKIDAQISSNIQYTMLWITAIAITSALIIALSGLALNISEYRVARAEEHADLGRRHGGVLGLARRAAAVGHREVVGVVDRLLLHERQHADLVRGAGARRDDRKDPGRRHHAVDRDVVVDGQADLLHVVRALAAAGRLAGRLHGGQQKRDQHADNGDHDQQLNERKAGAFPTHGKPPDQMGRNGMEEDGDRP